MAKYEMLITASGKRGSALLPCVVVDERALSVLLYGLRRWLELATRSMKNSMW